jgi:hypothetical protein
MRTTYMSASVDDLHMNIESTSSGNYKLLIAKGEYGNSSMIIEGWRPGSDAKGGASPL